MTNSARLDFDPDLPRTGLWHLTLDDLERRIRFRHDDGSHFRHEQIHLPAHRPAREKRRRTTWSPPSVTASIRYVVRRGGRFAITIPISALLADRRGRWSVLLVATVGIVAFGLFSLAPYAATWLARSYGLAAVGYYLSLSALVSLLALGAIRKMAVRER